MNNNDFMIFEGELLNYTGSDKHVVIPEGVTGIGNEAFFDCSSLTSVVIPDSVTSIGDRAFVSCRNLTSIAIPESVTSIGSKAFGGCSSLTSIVIPDSVTSIGCEAFLCCNSLTSVVIPDNVTSIGYEAFGHCSSLTSVVIPDNVTSIGYNAFVCCRNLTSVVIPKGVTSIGGDAFKYTPWLEQQGALVIINGILLRYQGEDTEICIPDGVTSIGEGAFSDCSNLTSIAIPDSVTSIGGGAFNRCRSLTSIAIPDSVTSIGGGAFSYCSNLTSIVIPDSVTSIGRSAFNGCRSLTSIVIPDSVTSIGGCAFSYCSSLTSIDIPEGVTSIGEYAFSDCNSLTSIVIPEGVTNIGDRAFESCRNLTYIVIPDGVIDIGERIFAGNYYIKTIKTGTKLTAKAFDKKLEVRPFITNDPSMFPASFKPYAAIGYARQPDTLDTPRTKAHFKYINSNAAKLMNEAFDYPELLHLMLENKLLKPEIAQAYVDEAIRRKLTEATAALLDYQQNKLSAAEKQKSADKAAAREETVTNFVFDTENLAILQGKVFVVTGKLKTFTSRDELKACLDTCQAILTENLDKDTDYLLTNTPNSGTAKNKKAESLGVKKITEDEFNQMIGRHPQ